MVESNLFQGCQNIPENPKELIYGVSVTDGCIGWDETEEVLLKAAETLREGKNIF